MCDPVTASLMIASAGATYAGNQKAQRKMEGAVRTEKSRQKAFAEGQQNALDASINNRNYTNSQKAIDDAKAALEKDYTQNDNGASGFGVDAGAPETASGSSNATVSDSYSRGETRAKTASKENAVRTAALQSFGNTMTAQQLANTRYAQDSAVLANMAQGSMGVLPYELQAASKAGDSLKTMGQVLSLASMYTGYMNAAGNGFGPSWGELFGTGEAAGAAASTVAPAVSEGPVSAGQITKAAPFQATNYSTYPGALKDTAVLPFNDAYTTFPASGVGPPSFNTSQAVQNGYQAQAGNYVGGVPKSVYGLPTEFLKRRPPLPIR